MRELPSGEAVRRKLKQGPGLILPLLAKYAITQTNHQRNTFIDYNTIKLCRNQV